MPEYSTAIEVWYEAYDQDLANIFAKEFAKQIANTFEQVNQVEIQGQPEEQ